VVSILYFVIPSSSSGWLLHMQCATSNTLHTNDELKRWCNSNHHTGQGNCTSTLVYSSVARLARLGSWGRIRTKVTTLVPQEVLVVYVCRRWNYFLF
jgi:hypothetical protein